MVFNWNGPALPGAVLETARDLGVEFSENGIRVSAHEGGPLSLRRTGEGIELEYQNIPQLCRALGILAEEFGQEGSELANDIREVPAFERLGAMLDVSRNAVPRPETVLSLLRRLAAMGYTQFMLYTEDTYPVPGEPWFGYMRGGYTREDLRAIDRYAAELGIELIPCVQTLAHLERFLHWPAAKEKYLDCNDVLLTDSPETDALLEKIFASLRECFSSGKVHIGMDEAMGLGLGKHLAQHGFEEPSAIMLRHLAKVCEMAKKQGFAPMMWSDMFFRLLSPDGNYYNVTEIPEEVKHALPEGLQLVYWDYYHDDEEFCHSRMDIHRKMDPETAFAGGAWNWLSPVTDYKLCRKNSLASLRACKKAGTRDMWLTLWGDDGAEASVNSTLLTLQLYAEFCYTGSEDEDQLAKRFAACCGVDAKPFMEMSRFNRPGTFGEQVNDVNACKFLLYQDPLLGVLDEDVRGRGVGAEYEKLASEYVQYAAQAKAPYDRLFDFYAKLASLLAVKAELGLVIRTAYKAGDKTGLERIASEVIPDVQHRLDTVRRAWRTEWMTTNRPHGFDILDGRMGATLARLDTAAVRIRDYLEGRVACLEELEGDRMKYLDSTGAMHGCFFWKESVSPAKAAGTP